MYVGMHCAYCIRICGLCIIYVIEIINKKKYAHKIKKLYNIINKCIQTEYDFQIPSQNSNNIKFLKKDCVLFKSSSTYLGCMGGGSIPRGYVTINMICIIYIDTTKILCKYSSCSRLN